MQHLFEVKLALLNNELENERAFGMHLGIVDPNIFHSFFLLITTNNEVLQNAAVVVDE